MVEYTLTPDDITAARLLAIGIRPRLEFGLFAVVVAGLLAWSVSPWSFTLLPLVTGLTACLGGFRLIQVGQVRETALAAYQRNPTLRRLTAASWDDRGVTIQPATALSERIAWHELRPLRENGRIVLLLQGRHAIHAIPKRAFPDKAALAGFRRMAQAGVKRR